MNENLTGQIIEKFKSTLGWTATHIITESDKLFDIVQICRHYPDIESETVWKEHNDLYDEKLSHNEVGLVVLGRQMKLIMSSNDKLYRRIIQIIDCPM